MKIDKGWKKWQHEQMCPPSSILVFFGSWFPMPRVRRLGCFRQMTRFLTFAIQVLGKVVMPILFFSLDQLYFAEVCICLRIGYPIPSNGPTTIFYIKNENIIFLVWVCKDAGGLLLFCLLCRATPPLHAVAAPDE